MWRPVSLGHAQQGLRVALQAYASNVHYRAATPVPELHDLGDRVRLVGQYVVVRDGLRVLCGADVAHVQLRLPQGELRCGEVVAGEDRLGAPGHRDAEDMGQVSLPQVQEEMLVHQCSPENARIDRAPDGHDLAGYW